MKTAANLLKIGQSGIINSVNGGDIALKLLEMNCTPGESILLERIAPLGDPMVFKISGYLLSLRKQEAQHIVVDL
jgi:ferrous iron transport protein A